MLTKRLLVTIASIIFVILGILQWVTNHYQVNIFHDDLFPALIYLYIPFVLIILCIGLFISKKITVNNFLVVLILNVALLLM